MRCASRMTSSDPKAPQKNVFVRIFRLMGPGVITGAADDDPSGIATYSIAGAQLGTSLLWTSVVTWPLMGAVQMMCARIGMVTGRRAGQRPAQEDAALGLHCLCRRAAHRQHDQRRGGPGRDGRCGGAPDRLEFPCIRHRLRRRHRGRHGEISLPPDRPGPEVAGPQPGGLCLDGLPRPARLGRRLPRHLGAALAGGSRDLGHDRRHPGHDHQPLSVFLAGGAGGGGGKGEGPPDDHQALRGDHERDFEPQDRRRARDVLFQRRDVFRDPLLRDDAPSARHHPDHDHQGGGRGVAAAGRAVRDPALHRLA